jgi:hypothetical protein
MLSSRLMRMDNKLENSFKNRDIEEISQKLGLHKNIIRRILDGFSRRFKNPDIIDSDKALVSAYLEVYKREGMEAARKEVARRIRQAEEIRALRTMVIEEGHLSEFYNVDDPYSLGSLV